MLNALQSAPANWFGWLLGSRTADTPALINTVAPSHTPYPTGGRNGTASVGKRNPVAPGRRRSVLSMRTRQKVEGTRSNLG